MGLFSRNSHPLDPEFRDALMFADAKSERLVAKMQQRVRERLAELCTPGETLRWLITSSSGKDLLVLTTGRLVEMSTIASDFDLSIDAAAVQGTTIGSLGTPPHTFIAAVRLNRPIRHLGGKKTYANNDFVSISRGDYDEALLVTSTIRSIFGVPAL